MSLISPDWIILKVFDQTALETITHVALSILITDSQRRPNELTIQLIVPLLQGKC